MAEPIRVDGLPSDRPQGHRRRGRPGRPSPRSSRPAAQRRLRALRARLRRAPRRRRAASGAASAAERGDRHAYRGLEPVRRRTEEGAPGHRRRVHDGDRDHGQDQHRRPLHVPGHSSATTSGARRRTSITWFSGHRMRFFAEAGPVHADRRRVGQGRGQLLRRASKIAATSDDSKPVPRPVRPPTPGRSTTGRACGPTRATQIPTTLDELQDARREDEDRRPRPDRPRRQGRLAGPGPLRHHQPPGERLRLPCRPDGRQAQKWTDPKVKQVFTVWEELLPFYQTGSAGRKWQDAAAGLVQKTTGMMLQPQVGETVRRRRRGGLRGPRLLPVAEPWDPVGRREGAGCPDRRVHADARSRPRWPRTWMPPRRSSSSSARARPRSSMPRPTRPASPTAKDADTSAYTPLQKKPGEGHRRMPRRSPSSSIATPGPTSPGEQGMQAFLQQVPPDPDQDLDAYQKKIQDF